MIVNTESDFQKALTMLAQGDVVAFDVETDGLNVRKNKVIGLGVSISETEGFYVYKEEHMIRISNLLAQRKLLAWNAYFDLEMVRNNFGVDLWDSLLADVVVLKHSVDEEHPFGLKDVAKKIYGTDATKEQEELKASIKANGGSPKEFFKADTDILGKYCIQDCLLTLKLFNHYSLALKEQGLESFFYKEEVMPLYKNVTRFMQSRGVPVDVKKAKKLQWSINQDINALEKQILDRIEPELALFKKWFLNKEYKTSTKGKFAQAVCKLGNLPLPQTKTGKYSLLKKKLEDLGRNRYAAFLRGEIFLKDAEVSQIQDNLYISEYGDKPMFNLLSKHHLKKLFFDTLGEEATSKTALGNPQVDDAFLEQLGQKYQWVKWLQDFNKLMKLKSSYIDRILDNEENGIFYPAFQQHRTISGRYGSDLQQLPRIAEEGQFSPLVTGYKNQIRALFISGTDHVFVDADYESLEPHIFAHVSGDPKIQEIFNNNEDFYTIIAKQTEGLTEVSKKQRQRAKAYALGIPYGMESYSLSHTLSISQGEAASLIRKYKEGFPQLAEWMEKSNKLVLSQGWVKSQAGRIRHLSRAQNLLKRYGYKILDSLHLYSEYHEDVKKYQEMKDLRKIVKNSLNNAKNFQIQSLAASITNRACIKIAAWLKIMKIDGYVCAQVHDQIIVRVPSKDKELTRQAVQDIMESVYKLDIKLKAPAEIGTNFAEAH